MADPIAPSPAPGAPPAGAPPAPAAAKPPAGAPPVPPPPPEPDPYDALLKTKPIKVKNRAGKEVVVTSRQQLDHYVGKGFGAHEAFEENNKLKAEVKARDEVLKRLEAGDDVSVEMLRKAYGPKWRQIVEKEALRDFEEEERLKNIPPHIRERLQEAERLKAEKAEREENDQRGAWQKKQAEQQAQLEQLHEEVKRIGIPVLQKLGFPEKPPASVIFRLASYLGENIELAKERGIEALPVEVVAEAVKEDMQQEYKALADGFIAANDFDGAVKWLGDDFVNFMRRSDLARLRAGGNPAPAPKVDPAPKKEDPDSFWRR